MMRFVIAQKGHDGEKTQEKNISKPVGISTFYSHSVTSYLSTIAVEQTGFSHLPRLSRYERTNSA